MQKSKTYLIVELILLFILLPCVLLLEIPAGIKAGIILPGVIYAIWTIIKSKIVKGVDLYKLPAKPYWKFIFIRFVIIVISTILFMYFFDNEKLFIVVKKNITFWLMLSIFYSVFSVYPQEFLYRSFFFGRYGMLFKNRNILIAVNAIIFSLAHIGFKNPLVLGITLIGGLIFAFTYSKTKSLILVSIEHAIYGSWLFTVGMGEMLAFPLPA